MTDHDSPKVGADQPMDTGENAVRSRAPGGGPPGGGDDSGAGIFGSSSGWVWALIAVLAITLVVFIVLWLSGDDADDTTPATTVAVTATTMPAPTTTTTETPTTTTTTEVPETTTTVPEPTTTVPEGPDGSIEIEASPLLALLGVDIPPYGSVEVVEPGTVEAHWYQWNGFFVILYRGVSSEANLCLGNSIFSGTAFEFITNSELGEEEPCDGATDDQLAGEDFGVRTCGELVYYLTEIPTTELGDPASGDLFGSVELWVVGADISGVTSAVATDLGDAPEFDPTALGYVLPTSDADELIEVACEE